MGVLRRRTTEREAPAGRRGDVVEERTGPSPGIVRALFTLAGVAGAGFLLWLAQLFNLDAVGGFWIAAAIIAGAGFALGLSQLFGGWTKWGWPTMSPIVFLLGFLPTLAVGGWILLAHQPEGGWAQGRFDTWTANLGLTGLVDAIAVFLWVVPLIVGLVLAFSFDTTGPRTRIATREAAVADEDVHDYRREQVETTEDRSVATELRGRDGEPEHATTAPRGEPPETRRDDRL